MSHKRTQTQHLENVHLEQREVLVPATGVLVAGIPIVNQIMLPTKAIMTFGEEVVVITDTGGGDGGYGAQAIMTLPAKRVTILGVVCAFTITSEDADIDPAAAVDTAVGTAAEAANATLDGTSDDIVAKMDTPLVAGVATVAGGSLTADVPITIDATAGTVQIFLNFGVPDADIGATDALIVTGTIEVTYLDLGDE